MLLTIKGSLSCPPILCLALPLNVVVLVYVWRGEELKRTPQCALAQAKHWLFHGVTRQKLLLPLDT